LKKGLKMKISQVGWRAPMSALLTLGVFTTLIVSGAGVAEAAPAPFILPVITSQTGAGAPYGVENVQAYNVAAKQINATGGISGHKLEFKLYDDQSSPTTAAELIRSVGSSALIVAGPDLTATATALLPVAKSVQVPVVSGSISDATVVATGKPWAFDTFIPSQTLLPPLVKQWLKVTPSVKNVALLYDSENAAPRAQGMVFASALKEDGVKIVKTVTVQTGQPSYQAQADAVASANPGGVAVCGLAADAAAMVHALRSGGFNGPVLLCVSATNNTLAPLLGSKITNVDMATIWWPTVPGAGSSSFTRQFLVASGGVAPATTAPAEYYSIKVIAQALNATHALTSKKSVQDKRNALRTYISKLKNFAGVNGTFSMNKGGYFTGPGVLLTYTHGSINIPGNGS
jgi:branched-chain amino acid transport system substrate-binding protein